MTEPSARPSRTSLLPAIDPKKFEAFEQSFLEAKDPVKLGRLYLSYAAQASDPKLSGERLRQGVQALAQLAGSEEQVSWLLHELVRLEPDDQDAFDAVRTYYESTEKHRELIRLLEDLFERSHGLSPARARELGSELYTLYRDKVDDKAHAARQLALLLHADPVEPEWLEHAEELIQTRGLIMHLGAPLGLAYQRAGKASQELSVLTRELEVARGARLTDVQSRLAALRQDFLDDADGAMELLEPLVSRDPAHDEARERYLRIARAQDRLPDAARRLKRALSVLSEPEARTRVGLDLARTLLHSGDREQAKQELVLSLEADSRSPAALASAQLLLSTFDDLAPAERILCLAAVAANETDMASRHRAATTLLELGRGEGLELSDALKKSAWLGLLDSEGAASILDDLAGLCERTGDSAALARVFERRAALALDPDEAAGFAFRAAELCESTSEGGAAALACWQQYSERFPRRVEGALRLANLLQQAGRTHELLDFLHRSAQVLDDTDAAALLARAGELEFGELGRPEVAMRSFQRALELNPAEPVALAALEDAMARGDRRLEAAAILEGVARRVPDSSLLADVLAVQSELLGDTEARKAADIELFELLRDELDDSQRALALAARVLKEATSRDRGALGPWLERIRSVRTPEKLLPLKARVLAAALGDQDIDGPELFTLARDAGLALTEAGNFDAASAVYEKALMYDPSAADLALGLDALRAKQGIAGAQRVAYLELSLIDVEENVIGWCRVMGAIASIHQNVLGDLEAAAHAYREVIERAPLDREAHRALVEIYEDTRDHEALGAELERAISVFSGTEQLSAEFALAMLRADSGDQTRAIDLCNKLLDAGSLTADQLEAIADLAERQDSPALLRRVQERRIETAPDPLSRARELERLGVLLSERLDDKDAGAEAFKLAARASLPIDGEQEYAKALFERALELRPSDPEAAMEFVRFCISAGDWGRIPIGINAMIASDPAQAASFVLELEERARADRALARYVAVVDDVLEVTARDGALQQLLMAARARVLAADPAQRLQASQAFRAVIEAFGSSSDEAGYEQFVKNCPLDDDRTDDQRWLFERRASSSSDPVSVLLDWARVEEEEFADPAGAIAVYDRLIQAHPSERRALERAARLKLQCGAYEGALDVLRQLEASVSPEEKPGVLLRIASLLIGELGRSEEGYHELAELLSSEPKNQMGLELALAGLASPDERVQSARTLAVVLDKLDDKAQVLARMLEALEGTHELTLERKAWYEQLIALSAGAEALKLACGAAAELPDALELWDSAEKLAHDLELPDPVAKAYELALVRDLPQDLVQSLGQRMLAFHEQWFGDSAVLLPALLNLLKQTPDARWALGRAVLALNGQGRFEEVFGLFDAAITYAPEGEERISLLVEAALTAKDLANDAERAIHYLEQLVELKPEDARAQSTLERLYKRSGHTRKLIELLTKRLADLSGPDLIAMLDQIACRWLELDHADEALASVRQILDLEPESERACQILERVLGTEDFADAQVIVSSELTETREQAAELLKTTYQRMGRLSDVVRIAETELEFLDDGKRRGQVLREIIAAKLGDLGDRLGAFGSLSKLVMLEPASKQPRGQLRALAEELGEPKRYAETLVRASEHSAVECELFLEAAQIYTNKLTDRVRETELYERVLSLAPDDATVLTAAQALDRLLSDTEDVDHHCEVLERLSAVETVLAARRDALVRAARIAADALGDWERAAKSWREVLSFAAHDREALDGLIAVLIAAKQWVDLIPVLEVRAGLLEGAEAKRDHVLIARTFAARLGDNARAIDRWQLIRERFGTDEESFEVLSGLLETESRWEMAAELLSKEAANAGGERRALLLHKLACVRRDHLNDYSGALEAFVAAREWRDAVSIIEAADTPEHAAELTDSLRVVAIERWYAGDELAEDAAYWAIKSRAQQLLDLTESTQASKRRRKGASPQETAFLLLTESMQLPFSVSRRRSLQRSAALVSCDALHEPKGALEIFGRMFAEDVTDTAAVKSVTKYSELLDQAGRHVDRAELWERIARALLRTGDEAGARSYWEHAGKLWEQLEEAPLAIAAYQRAADLNSVPSLEALTRLYSTQDDKYAALEALERIFELSSGESLAACAERVVDACLELGERHKARARLETAVQRLPTVLPLRARLAALYREEQADQALVGLLAGEVELRKDPEERLQLLVEAANLYQGKLGNPAAAIPLWEQAAALRSDDQELKLAVATAQSRAGMHDAAIVALTELIEAFGVRRPKTRASAHQKLGQALAAAGRHSEALAELALAAEINSTDAGLLFEYGTAALRAHELERAEQTFRTSLLVLHRPVAEAPMPVTRADVYLSLSEVAAQKGERLATKDFIESAFEIALEGPEEALELEASLKSRGKDELLKRALETRLTRSQSVVDRIRALSELTGVYARLDDKEARLSSVSSACARLESALGTSASEASSWKDLARVYAWLGDAAKEIDALEAYLVALPEAEYRARHADACYRVAEARVAEQAAPDKVLGLLRRAVALDPAPERRDALLEQALEAFPTHVGIARASVRVARMSGRENQLAEALTHLVQLPEANLEEGRWAVRQCAFVGNASLMERATGALLKRTDLDHEMRHYLQEQLAHHYQATGRYAEAFDLKLALSAEVDAAERNALLRAAAELVEHGLDDKRAALVYRKLLLERPDDRSVWEPLFATYLRLGDHAELKEIIEQTLSKVRGADRGALRLAQARLLLTDENEVDAAVLTLEKALDEDPGQREAAELLAETLERLGRLDELVSVFEGQLAAARAANDKQAFIALTLRVGVLLERANRPSDAVQRYEALLAEFPDHLQALRALVDLLDAAPLQAPVATLRRLFALETPENAAPVALKLHDLVLSDGDASRSVEILEEGFSKCPGDAELRRRLVDAYAQAFDVEGVAGVLSRAVEARPKDAELLFEAVDAWAAAGQPERALALLEGRLRERPGEARLHFKRAQLLNLVERDDEALAALERAHDEGGAYADELILALEGLSQKKGRPESDVLILRLADLLEKRGDDRAAREHLRTLLFDSPDNVEALLRLARLAEKHDDTSDAIQAFRGLMRLEQGDDLVRIVFKLIGASEKLGRVSEVLDDLERAREKLPDHERLRDRIRAVYEKCGETNRLADVLIEDAARVEAPDAKAALFAQAARLLIDTDPARAQLLLEQAERAQPSLESGVLLARLRALSGERSDAIADLEQLARASDAQKPAARVAAYWELCQLYLREDEIREAYDVLVQAQKLERRSGEIALLLGMLALDLDDEKTAGRALRSVTAMKERTGTSQGARRAERSKAYYLLSDMARRKGDASAARRMAQKAVGEDPHNQDAQSLLEVLG